MSFFPNYQPPFYGQPMQDQLAQLRQQQFQMPQQMPPVGQPQQIQYQVPQQTNIIWVRSEMEARNYLVAPNSSVTMWNENLPEIYLKKADSSGRPEFEAYDLVKREDQPQRPAKPEDEVITLRKLMTVLANLGLIQSKPVKTEKEELTDG